MKSRFKLADYFLLGLLVLALFSVVSSGRLITLFSFVFIFVAAGRLLLILKRKFFWKIRNRLIISSLFFTVTPMILISIFFLAVINLLIIQNNALVFENIMRERALEMERLAARYYSQVVNLEDRGVLLQRVPRQRTNVFLFFSGSGDELKPVIVDPPDFDYNSLLGPATRAQFQSGYFMIGGRLYYGTLREEEKGVILLADIMDQEYFNRLPRIGDFSVSYSPPPSEKKPEQSAGVKKNLGKKADVRPANSAPYSFHYWDFDKTENGKPRLKHHFFTLVSEYARVFQRVRVSEREKSLREEIAGLEKDLADGRLEIADGQRRLEELRQELAAVNSSDIFRMYSVIIYILLGVFGFFIITSLVIGFGMVRTISKSVDQIFRGTEKIRRGDFSFRIKLKSKDQMQSLADSFNEMAYGIKHLLQEEKERQRMEEELRIARSIQLKLLPEENFSSPEFIIAADNIPAAEIAGDYFDYFYHPGSHLTVLVADVSGKGASAAFYMAELKGLLGYLQKTTPSPLDLVDECHQGLASSLDKTTFITLNIARFDIAEKKIVFTRSGHTPAVFYRAAGDECLILTPRGPAIGISGFHRDQFESITKPYESGDILFFFSDGLSEIMNAEGEQLGVPRLADLLRRNHLLSPAEIRTILLDYSVSFSGMEVNPDDLTFLIVKVK